MQVSQWASIEALARRTRRRGSRVVYQGEVTVYAAVELQRAQPNRLLNFRPRANLLRAVD